MWIHRVREESSQTEILPEFPALLEFTSLLYIKVGFFLFLRSLYILVLLFFLLRFQELGGRLEGIMHSRSFELCENTNEWKLVVSEEAWSCMLRCWDNDIFIRQLAHRYECKIRIVLATHN